MINEILKPRVTFSGRHYRNAELAAFVIGTFKTAEEQRAAWETVKFIRETWPAAELALRGELIGVDEGEA